MHLNSTIFYLEPLLLKNLGLVLFDAKKYIQHPSSISVSVFCSIFREFQLCTMLQKLSKCEVKA